MTATPESMRRMQRRREQLAGIVRPRGGQPGVKRGPMRLKEEWPSRFERCIAYEPMTGCWLWIGTATRHGYGVTSVHMRKVLVHRESWRMHRGDIPDGLHVCHRPGRCRHRASEGEDLMLTCRRAVPCRHHVTARGRRPPLRGVPACRAAGGGMGGTHSPTQRRAGSTSSTPRGDRGGARPRVLALDRHRDPPWLRRHLRFLGTQAENMADAAAKGRTARGDQLPQARRTHCPRGHAYDADNTYRINGRRHCRTCKRDLKREARATWRWST